MEIGKPKHIFILSGQSNMAGRGGVSSSKQWDQVVPSECGPDPTRIFRLNANLKWEPAHEPLHADIDTRKTCGVGPGMSFANVMIKESTEHEIGLVPCAVGGTAIKEWARGCDLYENMIKRARFASTDGEIKAVLWYQGESDTSSFDDAEIYRSKMEELIRNVREDLDSPRLPFIQVTIISGDEKYLEKVRQAQKSLDLPELGFVDADGLPLSEDNNHLTTEAQIKLGQMLAHTYIQTFQTPIPPSQK